MRPETINVAMTLLLSTSRRSSAARGKHNFCYICLTHRLLQLVPGDASLRSLLTSFLAVSSHAHRTQHILTSWTVQSLLQDGKYRWLRRMRLDVVMAEISALLPSAACDTGPAVPHCWRGVLAHGTITALPCDTGSDEYQQPSTVSSGCKLRYRAAKETVYSELLPDGPS